MNIFNNGEAGCSGDDAYDTPRGKQIRVEPSLSTVPKVKPSSEEPLSYPEEAGYMDMRILRVFGKGIQSLMFLKLTWNHYICQENISPFWIADS